jgi:hypothetical protein
MEEAELCFKEAKQTGIWDKKAANIDTMYAFQATKVDGKRKHNKNKEEDEETNQSEIAALTAELKEYNEATLGTKVPYIDFPIKGILHTLCPDLPAFMIPYVVANVGQRSRQHRVF